ncbi:Sulfate adenylyltransferase subunit 1 [Arcticibacter svalbardensis MN12-7]|uniref:sulfate adenylyltransferase n=1 Tax=Arcticibacter svalbardensis MN12-7 TaxID=1150600 RepID=R9GVV3_9SPHI|nr:GTP-binding protein [Arcticibacter svalbardensis]EOR93059.1 Sulfate adenylyltransferase subunit 1 [Arcticibacter svalbardensis MN12-7]
MDLLRFITAGSVDDGKSTLIGRLLYDTDSIKVDQLETILKQSKNKSEGEIDLALFTDGLRAEREQGITIDVAYKYFATEKRKFIIADAPGHIQYTRNMVTGASNSDLIIILVDARLGVIEQTRRHSIIASLLQIPHVVVTINKMDMVNFSEEVYNTIVADYSKMADMLKITDVTFIPISALNGDNIVNPSINTPWYKGETLLNLLETINISNDINYEESRFPVQFVIRPQSEDLHDYRGYAGKVLSGTYKKGDVVTILPDGIDSTIKAVEVHGIEVDEAFAPQSAVIRLTDDIDINRGDLIVKKSNILKVSQEIEATLCWMDNKPLVVGNKYLLQVQSKRVRCVIKEINYKLDVNTLEKQEQFDQVGLNDVVHVLIKTASPIAYDSYNTLRANGGAILIDETAHTTVAGCMLS